MRLTGYILTLGLTSLIWNIVGYMQLGNLLLYNVFCGVSCVVIFALVLAILSGKRLPDWRMALAIGAYSAVAILSDPLSLYAIMIALLALALSRGGLRYAGLAVGLIAGALAAYADICSCPVRTGSLSATFWCSTRRSTASIYAPVLYAFTISSISVFEACVSWTSPRESQSPVAAAATLGRDQAGWLAVHRLPVQARHTVRRADGRASAQILSGAVPVLWNCGSSRYRPEGFPCSWLHSGGDPDSSRAGHGRLDEPARELSPSRVRSCLFRPTC